MTEKIQLLLADLHTALADLYGKRLVQIILYGSYARGDAHEESDVDVMVVLHGPVDPAREIRRMGTLALTIGLDHEKLISLFPISEKTFATQESALLQAVRNEGVVA